MFPAMSERGSTGHSTASNPTRFRFVDECIPRHSRSACTRRTATIIWWVMPCFPPFPMAPSRVLGPGSSSCFVSGRHQPPLTCRSGYPSQHVRLSRASNAEEARRDVGLRPGVKVRDTIGTNRQVSTVVNRCDGSPVVRVVNMGRGVPLVLDGSGSAVGRMMLARDVHDDLQCCARNGLACSDWVWRRGSLERDRSVGCICLC
eukprot:scaffold772_cov339-Pavlova_lutheri.AAC.21